MKDLWSDTYAAGTPTSKRLFERAQQVLPAGVSYAIRDIPPHPFYVDRAEGCRLYDVDGNAYTDYWSGHGALLLGHCPKQVVEAVARQLERGTHFGFCHPLEIELAELVRSMMPGAEMIRYTNSGTEANMYAVGLARAHTGRTKIAKAEGGWHGGYDALNKAVRAPFTVPEAAGISARALDETLTYTFNDLDSVWDVIKGKDVACVVIEPMMGAAGFIPVEPAFLAGLKTICGETGTLLIFDEVVTGFRLGPGGAQELFGVRPDISVIGKIMGGGFPVGALCGRRDVFERLDHRRFPRPQDRAAHGGTFSANPVSMAAGIATLTALRDGEVYAHLDRLGEQARAGLEAIFSRTGIDAAITGLRSTFTIHFQKRTPRNARDMAQNDVALARRYYDFLLSRRIVYLTPTVAHMFLNAAHSTEDVARFLSDTEDFARAVAA
jgi:glutamate-1-semialdehyde 2,1-aminomutase